MDPIAVDVAEGRARDWSKTMTLVMSWGMTYSRYCAQFCQRGYGIIGTTNFLLNIPKRKSHLSDAVTWRVTNTTRFYHASFSLSKRRKTAEERKIKNAVWYPPKSKKSDVIIQVWKNITVRQLAEALKKDVDHVFEVMIFVENSEDYDTPNSEIDNMSVISEIVKKSGQRCIVVSNPFTQQHNAENRDAKRRPPANIATTVKRPPVVTIMGHVDHGKTTLLDSLRNTSVVLQEFGGITQHIGAFSVEMPSGEKVTFLDTPGHAAFYAMRSRGAHVTDMVVLVVAADDGVMEQTAESINLAKESNVPIIIAINKIDKANANIEQCKTGLLTQGIQLEDEGGDVQVVYISALKGTNLNILVETILMQAELMDLRADPKGFVEGFVIESRTDPARGKLSTALIHRGTLRKGAYLVAGTAWAKVRSMFDGNGMTITDASPGTPVEVIGWKELPSAGDELLEVESEKRAREVVEWRITERKIGKMEQDQLIIDKKAEEHNKTYKEHLLKKKMLGRKRLRREGPRPKEYIETDLRPRLSIVLKGDVDGSVEAILDVLETFHSNECRLDVVHYGVGPVNDTDINLAIPFKGIVYGFNVPTLSNAKIITKTANVPIRNFNIIYRLIEDITNELNLRLPMADKEQILGEANVLQEFVINEGKSKWPVAGCLCTKGVLKKSAIFKVVRGEDVIHEGMASSMRHIKNEVESINKDVECGLRLSDTNVRFLAGDTIICLEKIKVPQKVDWDPGF